MRIAIAGGHGQIARFATRRLTDDGHEVVSLIRDPGQFGDIRADGGVPVECDIEQSDAAEVAGAMGAVDSVVFAAGAGPGSGAARKETVDHLGATKLLEAAAMNEAAHYVMISAIGADAEHPGDEVFDHYLRAKGRADDAVRHGSVPHTIIRPTSLTDDDPAGTVTLAETAGGGPVSRADVGAVVAAVTMDRAGLGRTVQLTAGDTPVEDAVRALS